MAHSSTWIERHVAPWRGTALAAVLPAWGAARVLALVAWLLVQVTSKHLVGHHSVGAVQGPFGWMAWDGGWYQSIARHGYGGVSNEALRFFPLYPMLGKALAWLLGGNTQLALLLLSNGGALLAGVLLHRLVIFETGSPSKASRAVWYLALFPSSFVLVWAYAESLFLCAAIGAFLAYRKQRWGWAIVAGLAAGMLRPVGCFLALPAIVEVARLHRRALRPACMAAVAAPIAGLLAYLLWVGIRFGNWLAPYTVQQGLRGKTVNPVTRVADGLQHISGPEGLKQNLHLPFAFIFIVLLVVVLRRWPLSYGLFAGAVLLAALGSTNINSLERYALNGFPLILGLVVITENERIDRLVSAFSVAGFMALASLALVAAYVP